MTVSIDATNMVLVDVADGVTGWTSSMGGLQTTTILTREGGVSLEDQASQETFGVYHTIGSTDLSAGFTVFGWMRSGGPDTETADGFSMYLGDGTNNRIYTVGGSDSYGFFLIGWSSFRLNTVLLPGNFLQDGGGAPTLTAITRLGYGGNFPAKAAGNSNNVAWDVLRYVDNADPALLIEGGTTGARGTWQEVATEDDDTTNAWGIIRQLVPGSKNFEIMFGLQVGSLDANAYFEDADFQLFLNGTITDASAGITAGSMDFTFVGGGAFTNVVNFDNFFVQSIDEVSNWDASDTDLDELQWTNGQFVDMGTFTFQAQDVGNKFLSGIIFVNCGMVTVSNMDMDDCTFNGATDANGAITIDEDADTITGTQSNLNFTSDGTGHAVYINPVGAGPFEIDFDNWQFDGYSQVTDNVNAEIYYDPDTPGALMTINILNGGKTPSVRTAGGATAPTIVSAFNYELTGLDAGADVTIVDITTPASPSELFNEVAGVDGIVTYAFDGALTGTAIGVYIRNTIIVNNEFDDTLPGANVSFPADQRADDVYFNP